MTNDFLFFFLLLLYCKVPDKDSQAAKVQGMPNKCRRWIFLPSIVSLIVNKIHNSETHIWKLERRTKENFVKIFLKIIAWMLMALLSTWLWTCWIRMDVFNENWYVFFMTALNQMIDKHVTYLFLHILKNVWFFCCYCCGPTGIWLTVGLGSILMVLTYSTCWYESSCDSWLKLLLTLPQLVLLI